MLSNNSSNIIKNLFIAPNHSVKTFFETLAKCDILSSSMLEIEKRISSGVLFSPPLRVSSYDRTLNIYSTSSATFDCIAIFTSQHDGRDILSIELLFCIPKNTSFAPSVSLTYKVHTADFGTVPNKISSLIKTFNESSITQKNIPDDYPINLNNLTYETVVNFAEARTKVSITEALAKELTNQRKAKGYTQTKLSEISEHFANSTNKPLTSLVISRIESRKLNSINIEQLYLLEQALELPHGYFADIANGKKNPIQIVIKIPKNAKTTELLCKHCTQTIYLRENQTNFCPICGYPLKSITSEQKNDSEYTYFFNSKADLKAKELDFFKNYLQNKNKEEEKRVYYYKFPNYKK